ncbi:MAG: DUF4956 domain-containing protein [Vallitaleaceae bacterium]|nr:DUF4956 domain-containing protein [Vallitaleaceae bacterium]
MNLKKLQILMESNKNIDLDVILFYFLISLLLTSMIFLVYKITFSGVAYSKNFNVSIVLTGIITTMIMMVIGNNLALSLGMVGALSIVRFRAAIKEPKDISYLFWSIAVGLSTGTGAILIATVGSCFIAITILLYQFGFDRKQQAYLLIIKGDVFDTEAVLKSINKHVKRYRLRMKNTKKDSTEAIYEIRLKNPEESKLVQELYTHGFVKQVNLVTFDGHLNE